MTRGRAVALGIGAVLVVLIAARIALPYALEAYVNRVLDQDPDYDGHVGDIDVFLILGKYRIDDVDIVRTDGDAPTPLFEADAVDIALDTRALLKGKVVGRIDLTRPVLDFAVRDSGAVQDGSEADWREVVLDLFPVRIDRLTIDEGTVRYSDVHSSPEVDLRQQLVNGEVRNLTNVEGDDGSLVADIDFRATAMESGALTLSGALDPFADAPTFDIALALEGLHVTELNPWFEAYADFDVESGTVDVYTELAAEDGGFSGYLKPLLHDVEVRRPKEGDKPVRAAWETVVGAVAGVFNNRKEDQVATVAPLKGAISSPEVGLWRTLGEALGNAFIDSLEPGFEPDRG